jgi:integrase
MGWLYQVGRTWYYGYQDHQGKWVRRSARTDYKPAARLKLQAAELRAARGEAEERPPTPLKAFLEKHLEAQRPTLDPSGHERCEYCLAALTGAGSPLAGLTLAEVSIGACSQYVSWRLAAGKTKATVNREVGWLKAALAEAARQELASWEAVGRIREEIGPKRLPALRRAQKARERVLLPREIPVLLAAAQENANLRDALTVALWTGLRQGNILELAEGQVDFTCEPAVARFTPAQMKNDQGHLVKLAPAAREVLWRRWKGDPTWPDRRFFSDFRPAWKRLQARLKGTRQSSRRVSAAPASPRLPDFRFHDLRRTYTSYRLAAGIDPKTVQDEVGHQDSRMTMDCYGRALRDPGIRAWAMERFRFPWDPMPMTPRASTRDSEAPAGVEAEQRK